MWCVVCPDFNVCVVYQVVYLSFRLERREEVEVRVTFNWPWSKYMCTTTLRPQRKKKWGYNIHPGYI